MSRINDNNNGNGNGNRPPPRRKRRWYRNPAAGAGAEAGSGDKKQKIETPIDRERERIENEKQVLKMEQQLHEYFHKSKTPYSYIDDKGIYNFTPTPAPAPIPTPPPPAQPTTTTTNPFMNMTFSPFVPSNTVSLFSNGPGPNIWASIFPIAQFQAPQSTSQSTATATATTYVPSSSQSIPIVTVDISENIQHIDDIIALCDKYPLADNTKYNINMTAIHAIREPLTDLSNMVGMTTIKRTIVDQILYYLQDLHIPEPKNNGSNTTNTNNNNNDQERTASNNNDLREKLKENVKKYI